MSFQPRTRLQKILMGIAATPRTALEHAVKYAVDHAGGGGGSSSDFVRVPFMLTTTEEGFSGTTDAVFSDVMAEKKKGKIIVAAAKVNIYNEVTQYIDLILLTLDADEESRFEGVAWMLSGSGTNLEAYDFKWTNDGVTVVQKKIAVS